jgi:hypothetical protein
MKPDEMRRAEHIVDSLTVALRAAGSEHLAEMPTLRKAVADAIAAALSTTAARYRDALEPFAELDRPLLTVQSHPKERVVIGVEAEHLRRAAAVLAQTTPQET